jgi:cold shock CspA family protein
MSVDVRPEPGRKDGAANANPQSGREGQNKMIRQGTVVHFAPARGFGFISSLDEETGAHEKFFFHVTRIVGGDVEVHEIKLGMIARFTPSDKPPKKEGGARYASDIEIYKLDPSTAAALQLLAGGK